MAKISIGGGASGGPGSEPVPAAPEETGEPVVQAGPADDAGGEFPDPGSADSAPESPDPTAGPGPGQDSTPEPSSPASSGQNGEPEAPAEPAAPGAGAAPEPEPAAEAAPKPRPAPSLSRAGDAPDEITGSGGVVVPKAGAADGD